MMKVASMNAEIETTYLNF